MDCYRPSELGSWSIFIWIYVYIFFIDRFELSRYCISYWKLCWQITFFSFSDKSFSFRHFREIFIRIEIFGHFHINIFAWNSIRIEIFEHFLERHEFEKSWKVRAKFGPQRDQLADNSKLHPTLRMIHTFSPQVSSRLWRNLKFIFIICIYSCVRCNINIRIRIWLYSRTYMCVE